MFYTLIEEMVSLSIIMNTTLIFPFVSGMKILWIIIKEEFLDDISNTQNSEQSYYFPFKY